MKHWDKTQYWFLHFQMHSSTLEWRTQDTANSVLVRDNKQLAIRACAYQSNPRHLPKHWSESCRSQNSRLAKGELVSMFRSKRTNWCAQCDEFVMELLNYLNHRPSQRHNLCGTVTRRGQTDKCCGSSSGNVRICSATDKR